ncbi:MAG: TonB-dependent receptor plug domain-containing protein, partial [Spirochaetales bacterium]
MKSFRKTFHLSGLIVCFMLIFFTSPETIWAEELPKKEAEKEEVPLWEGEGITVTATVEASQQIRRIEKEEIRRLQAVDLTALLEQAFQIGITRNGPYGSVSGVSLRGYGSGRVAILVDGVPLNSPQNGGFDLGRFSPEDLEAIEVIYGGSDTRFAYSGAQGGIINLITRRKTDEGSRWEASLVNRFPLPEPYSLPNGDRVWPSVSTLADTQTLRLAYVGNWANKAPKTYEGTGVKEGSQTNEAMGGAGGA